MDRFSISQLSQLSGIKAHTIRVWEQRYNALIPQRSEGNTRYYDNSQLRRLLNIVSLMNDGHRVSELCSLSDEELFKRLKDFYTSGHPESPEEYYISQLIAAGMSFDEAQFEKVFSHCHLRLGLIQTYIKVIYPLIVRMGLMWSYNAIQPGYEHFNTNLLRQKFHTAIDALPPVPAQKGGWLLFLPEDEYHELGLLFSQYLIRLSGDRSVYLGANLPLDSIVSTINQIEPDNLLLFLVHNEVPERAQEYLDSLALLFFGKNIYVSGNPGLLEKLRMSPPLKWLQNITNLEQVLH